MFKNMSIGTKLIVAFCLASCITLAVGVAGYLGATKLGHALENVAGTQTPSILGLGYMNEAQTAVQRAERTLLISGLDQKAVDHQKKRLADAWANAEKGWKIYEPLPQTTEEAKLWKEFIIAWDAWKKNSMQVVALIDQSKSDEARALSFGNARDTFKVAEELLGKITEINAKGAVEEHEKSKQLITSVTILTTVMSVIGFIVSIGLGLLIARNIKQPLAAGVHVAERIAAGDLTVNVEVNSRDETGQLMSAMKNMVENLRHMVAQTVDVSAGIASASNQLQATSGQIATGAEEVACQSNAVATASEEMSATSTDIARNCIMAAEASQHTTESATAGAGIVQETISGMSRIAERVRGTSQTVEALGARSDQIGEIVGTIEDIADQTNLLALNAAIEAARAGEQGRGFAVVADEVRALAERTTKATHEISDMIKAIQKETQEAVKAMEEGVREVENGAVTSRKSGHALEEILERINEVSMQINQIATAAEEQTATTGEVSSNIHQITEVVQQTARGAEETATAAAQLSGQARQLQDLVGRFRLA